MQYTYCLADLDSVASPLGVPCAAEKEIPFSSSPMYLGYFWDMGKHIVGIPVKKKAKYIAEIDVWLASPMHTLPEAQKRYGNLMHPSNIIPPGPSFVTVHTCHADLQNPFAQILIGGENVSRVFTSPGQSQAPSTSLTSKPTPTQALELVWVSQLGIPGKRGNSSLDGDLKVAPLRGPKQSRSNSLFDAYSKMQSQAPTSMHTAITLASLMPGNTSADMTYKSTKHSKEFMIYANHLLPLSTQHTSQVHPTLLTTPPED